MNRSQQASSFVRPTVPHLINVRQISYPALLTISYKGHHTQSNSTPLIKLNVCKFDKVPRYFEYLNNEIIVVLIKYIVICVILLLLRHIDMWLVSVLFSLDRGAA